ncbi:MAG: family 20 glycosylhydrolase [Oligosphaeraceae bacterium]
MPRPTSYEPLAPAFAGAVPRSLECKRGAGEFLFGKTLSLNPLAAERLGETLRRFGTEPVPCEGDAQLVLSQEATLPAEGFRLEVTPSRISLAFSDASGRIYGLNTLEQLLYLAYRYGADQAMLECGTLTDQPRLPWRGVMLDSARHFQSAEVVKRLLRAMGRLRLNRFHWHLTDGEGWRLPCPGAPELSTLGRLQEGGYRVEEIQEIRAVARENGIMIVPEIDFPGHNGGLLTLHKELRCDPEGASNEVCLGNPDSLAFAKARFQEAMELFPESRYFHIGGDEAWDGNWRACPKCQAKCRELGLPSARKLEEWFMRELSQFLLDHGRTPISWRTEAILTPENVLQCWGNANDMNACAWHDKAENLVISSIDNAYYLDYPQSPEEPRFSWMVNLSEEGVYSANPAAHMGEKLGTRLLGLECPLWTELVPEWRLGAKFFPRLVAAAESAWSPAGGSFGDYLSRRRALELAGYLWW